MDSHLASADAGRKTSSSPASLVCRTPSPAPERTRTVPPRHTNLASIDAPFPFLVSGTDRFMLSRDAVGSVHRTLTKLTPSSAWNEHANSQRTGLQILVDEPVDTLSK